MIVAFSPTVGFQALLAVGLATLVNANRPIAVVPIWITNPLTMVPIYAFTYWVGRFFWTGPPPREVARALRGSLEEVSELGSWAMREQLDVFLGLGLDVFVPMAIGGLVVGVVAAGISYPLTLRAVVALRRRYAGRRRRGKARRRLHGTRFRRQRVTGPDPT